LHQKKRKNTSYTITRVYITHYVIKSIECMLRNSGQYLPYLHDDNVYKNEIQRKKRIKIEKKKNQIMHSYK